MGEILSRLALWFNPVLSLAVGSAGVVTFLLGAIANPGGLWNQVANRGIDLMIGFLPPHPQALTLGGILAGANNVIPGFGAQIISEVAISISAIFGITALIKIYKLIPFKFS